MQYALLIYTQEPMEEPSGDEVAAETEGYNKFGEHLQQRNAIRAGDALQPTSTATTVRVRDGKTIATDGPFAETKEALGGFYIVEAADLDEAIGFAAMIPGATHGSIEVRPIFDFNAASAERAAQTVGAD